MLSCKARFTKESQNYCWSNTLNTRTLTNVFTMRLSRSQATFAHRWRLMIIDNDVENQSCQLKIWKLIDQESTTKLRYWLCKSLKNLSTIYSFASEILYVNYRVLQFSYAWYINKMQSKWCNRWLPTYLENN